MEVERGYGKNAPQQQNNNNNSYYNYNDNKTNPNVNVIYQITYNPSPANPTPVQTPPRVSGWFDRNQKNKPQSNSVGSAALIFISGGMNMAYGVGPMPISYIITYHMKISWFIGAIIGAIVAAVLCNRLQKKLIYLFSSVLVVIGGILFVSLPHSYDGIITARYIDGIANGLIFVPTLTLAGEECIKNSRGMLASTIEVMCFSLGFYLRIIYGASLSLSTTSFTVGQIQGCLSIFYGILAFIFAMLLVIESPIFYLVRGQEEQAIDSLRRLQRPFIITTETYEQLAEHKRYIAFNKEMSCGQSAIAGLFALFKLCCYRALMAMTLSNLINFAFLTGSIISQGGWATWPFIIYATLRWLAILITAFTVDSVGRKKPMLFGSIICGGLAIGVGALFDSSSSGVSTAATGMYLLFVFQFFAGVFCTPSSAYLSEAFPLAIKPYYIAFTFIVEMLVHIIICSASLLAVSNFMYALGALLLAYFIFGILCFPETKYTTLLEAQQKFQKCRSQ